MALRNVGSLATKPICMVQQRLLAGLAATGQSQPLVLVRKRRFYFDKIFDLHFLGHESWSYLTHPLPLGESRGEGYLQLTLI